MKSYHYPEINRLNEVYIKHHISIEISDHDYLDNNINYPLATLVINKVSYKLYIDDEYKDSKISNPLLWLCLILKALEHYNEEEDYLSWCNSLMLNSSNSQVRSYHMDLRHTYKNIELQLGEIDSHISDFDLELNAGAAQELRRKS